MRSCLPSPNKYRSKSVTPTSVKSITSSYDGLHRPYAVRVLANTAVAREVAHVQAIDDRFVAPFVFQQVQGVNLILRKGIRGKVREHQEGFAVAQRAADHRFRIIRTSRREESRLDEFQGALEFGVGVEFAPGLVVRAPRRDLFRRKPENEHVLRSDMVADLDIGSVQRADGQRSVQRQLHIAGTRRLHTGRGNLLRQVRRRHDSLRERDVVVRQEHDAQLVAHGGIRVDGARHVVDELDDGLGHRITRSRLAGKDHGAGYDVGARILAYAPIAGDYIQEIQELALVLVDSLHLHVEQGVDADLDAGAPDDLVGEPLLVGSLDAAKLAAKFRIIGGAGQAPELFEIVFPRRPQAFRQQRRQAGIRLFQPAAHRDSVGHIDESIGIQVGKTGKHLFAHEVGVQLSDPVDPMTADDRKMRHSHPAIALVVDDRQAPAAVKISGVVRFDRLQKIAVDQIDDLQMPRQQALEHRHGPRLERLRQQRVIGVRKHSGRDLPAFGPRQAVLVDQQAHELRNRHRRVRVVQLNGDRVRNGRERAPLAQMRRQDVLQARADEEILLLEPQLLALRRGVVRVQHARQVLGFQLLLHGGRIVAGIEGVDMKRGDGATGPEAQMIDGGTAVTRSQLVESDGVDIRRVDPAVQFGRSRVLRNLDSAAESHSEAHAAARHFPDIAQAQPAARDLALAAVGADDLREYAVVIANAVADGRVLQRGQRIEEARRQTTQAAVTQAGIDLLRGDVLEFMTHIA